MKSAKCYNTNTRLLYEVSENSVSPIFCYPIVLTSLAGPEVLSNSLAKLLASNWFDVK